MLRPYGCPRDRYSLEVGESDFQLKSYVQRILSHQTRSQSFFPNGKDG
jgi:hypothetical protein